MSDFKSNEYNLIGGNFEPHEENPMIGFGCPLAIFIEKGLPRMRSDEKK
jgi:phosphoenolpyruvate synthase/pyruvate phosphate dikinase